LPDDRFLHRRAGHSEKVNLLTDLEFRVWTQYLLSADDFGVMRFSAITVQSDNDHLENRPMRVIQRCLDALVKAGLLRTFEHQRRAYLYQADWQDWQKVSYPRSTTQPKPPDADLANCSQTTQLLFMMHPGGAGRKRVNGANGSTAPTATVPERSENIPETVSEDSPLMRAGAPAKRLMANGLRLTANGSEEDGQAAFMRFQSAYPASRRKGGRLVQEAFVMQMALAGGSKVLLAALDNHMASEQWQTPKHIPGMDTWLQGEYWRQVLDAPGAKTADSRLPEWAR
jgi:hypothetical protein